MKSRWTQPHLQTGALDKLLNIDDMANKSETERKMQEAMDPVSQACANISVTIPNLVRHMRISVFNFVSGSNISETIPN